MNSIDLAIIEFIRKDEADCTDSEFNELALRLFQHQYENNATYQRFCESRQHTPGAVQNWEDIPAVPTDAFKSVDFCSFPLEQKVRTFISSGTTQESRSRHHLETLAVYEASLLPSFARHLLPDGAEMQMLSLTPSSESHSESSLYFMIGRVMKEWGAEGSCYFIQPDGTFATNELADALESSQEQSRPMMLLGAAFSFVYFLDWMTEKRRSFQLPPGSRLMETGGYKGQTREISRDELLTLFEQQLGVPSTHCVNEYGMTELCVQFYDHALRDMHEGLEPRRHKSIPHWSRVQILDPESLQQTAEGETGIIQVCDLSNRCSIIQIMTADLGRKTADGFEILGRASTAESRGCSLTLDELLRSGC